MSESGHSAGRFVRPARPPDDACRLCVGRKTYALGNR